MNTNLFAKISIVLLLICFVGKAACAQPYMIILEQIEVAGDNNIEKNNTHIPKRSPARYILPIARYDAAAGTLCLEAQSDVALAYAIKDDEGLTLDEGELELTAGERRDIDVSGLEAGTYTLYLRIGGLVYAGVFETSAI